MNRKSVCVNKKDAVTLTNFFKRGFGVVRDGDVVHMHLPGFRLLSDIPNNERSGAVQAICIPLNFLMLSVGILMTGVRSKPPYS